MIVLGLGSNLGDRLAFLKRAIRLLKDPFSGVQVISISPIYESPALLLPNSPQEWNLSYLNLTVLCTSSLSSPELLKRLKTIEAKLGREPRGKWAPREIDIDILTREGEEISLPELKIPHPELLKRPFAFLPHRDVRPQMKLFPDPTQWPQQAQSGTQRSKITLTETVGILNITPDSFSDGGTHLTPEAVLQTAQLWCQNGVRILDLGAESTRPGATPIHPTEEQERLAPILEALAADSTLKASHVILSLDTRHPQTARWGLTRGVQWINDVSGLDHSEMVRVVADSGAQTIFMHSLSVPSNREIVFSEEVEPVDAILSWADQKIAHLTQAGIARENLIFDPGLGFGKTGNQNWQIIRELRRFHDLGLPILVGHSRKSFLASLGKRDPADRDFETAILSVDLYQKGVDYLRVHQPLLTSRALMTWGQASGVISCRI